MPAATNAAIDTLQLLAEDFDVFSEECLRLLDMGGKLVPFKLNRAQRLAHAMMEEQLRDTGMVRAIILKGRKQGLSTYIGGRFYHKVSMRPGTSARVLAHMMDSSNELFAMVRRYHDHNPIALPTKASSSKELVYGDLDSRYLVQTAGSREIGRGATSQLLHGSEIAFWDNSDTQMGAIGNIVADVPGTEVVLESTANGEGNAFHSIWQRAIAGQGLYRPIFVPWFWEGRYKATPPKGFEDLSADEETYQSAYGLTLEQMVWRRNKILTYSQGFEWLFDQEFPAVPELAFRSATKDPFISPLLVSAARNSTYYDKHGALVIGCDPAEYGDDSTAIVWRRGRLVLRVETYSQKGPMETANLLARYWKEGDGQGNYPDLICIDKTNSAGIVDRLAEILGGRVGIRGINFGEAAQEPDRYYNRKAEIWARTKLWLEDGPCRLPHNDRLAADLSAPGYSFRDAKLWIEPKDKLKARGIRSPDVAEALALTFAETYFPPRSEYESALTTAGGSNKRAPRAGY